ncbi:antitermination protein [Buttiauxella sp. BIGb0552]|uniref:antitermination protein Q n=1 Tax=Buttiauxella sp. BIGb0552 TaxID=2485120 RepID=UPI001065269D|nr:antitermination protein [Buttiauxella sp. BIGb0552]TDX18504.1 antitermination protein [Buttiauxella sp. BIGb0552]
MNLESLPKFYSPKSPKLNDVAPATGGDALTITDVMAAQGMVQSKAPLGFNLFLAKMGIQSPEPAIKGLFDAASTMESCRAVSALPEDKRHNVLNVLAIFAFADYSRSAASVRKCVCCCGEGFIESRKFVMNQLAAKRETVTSFERGDLPASITQMDGREMIARHSYYEITKCLCPSCQGKKTISNSCRCHGKGKVLDEEQTTLRGGVPVLKDCDKCSGRGYSRLKFSTVMEALVSVWPELKRKVAYEQVRPFFESLVTRCLQEEAGAEQALNQVTK